MKTVGQIVTDTSVQLNDQKLGREFTRWTRAQLLSYFNGGLAELSAYRPEAFTVGTQITLAQGRKQTLSDKYKTVVSLDTNIDGTPITEADYDLLRNFAAYSVNRPDLVFNTLGNPEFNVKSFAIDPKSPKQFYVSPEIPAGITAVVNATVIAEVQQYTLADWGAEIPVDAKYSENLFDYMQARAYDIDTESPMSRANADKHYARFYQAFGIKYRIESKYRSGYYNGAVGDGDPNAGRL